MLGALMLAVAACGGGSNDGATGDNGDQPAPTEAGNTQPTDADGGSDDTTPPAGDVGSDSEGSGPSTASVTLGDETYTFSTEDGPIAQCLTDLYGVFSVQLPGVDGGIQIAVLHEGTDPAEIDQLNEVRVSVGDEDWVADESDEEFGLFDTYEQLKPGMSQVDSVEIDGRTVRGTATFVRLLSLQPLQPDQVDVEIVTGTFEATCGEERLS